MKSSFKAFIEEYQAANLTKKAYEQTLELFDRFLEGNEPTEDRVERFMLDMEKRGLSSASINRHLSAIRAYFLWRRKKAPMTKRATFDLMVRGPKVHHKITKRPSADEVTKLLQVCENNYERGLVMTLYDGALRISELMGLKAEDIDYADKVIKITGKGGDEWRIPVGDKTLQVLKEYTGDRQGKVFPEPYWKIKDLLRRLGKQAGILKLNPHQLRHARASEMRKQGVELEDIKDFLRQKNYDTTLIYAHLEPEELKKRLPPAF